MTPIARQMRRRDAKRPRLPRQVWPSLIERDYGNRMVAHLDVARSSLRPVENEIRSLIEAAQKARSDGRLDAGEGDGVKRLVDRARASMRQAVSPKKVTSLAGEFAHKVQTYQRKQLGKQVRAALAVDAPLKDKKLATLVDHFVSENVSLIQSLPSKVHDDVEHLVLRAVAGGRLNKDLADEIDDRFDVGESHARLIARDQIGKLYGQINAARQQELGVSRFVWRTVGDTRVRDEHEELESQSESEPFDYDDPPLDDDGTPILPGEPIQCRCYAEPVFEDVLGDEETDDA